MNQTILTGPEIKEQYPDCKTLGDVFSQVDKLFQKSGQVICRYWINGMLLSEIEESKFQAMQANEIEELKVDTETPVKLLFDLIQNWIHELPILVQASDELSQRIKFSGMDHQYKSFVDLVDSCQFLVESLISLEKIITVSSEVHQQWQTNAHKIALAIQEVLEAFKKKDFVSLAEILEYEMGDSLQSWVDLLNSLQKELTGEYERDRKSFEDRVIKKSGTAQGPDF